MRYSVFGVTMRYFVLVALMFATDVLCLDKKLLIVSFDGFRSDYLDRIETPNIDGFIKEGVRADYVTPTFITKTFPTHYSIVTGLYQESHGIVGNSMYDPILNDTFDMDTHDTEWWDNGGEPMWVTVSKQGGRSAKYFWVGGEAETNGGYRPDIWIPYNESHSYTARIDTVVKWFTEENIDFVALYFDEPDGAGHDYGHGSDEIEDMVKNLDKLFGYLIDSFKSAGLYDIVDIIVTADHGMTDIFAAQKIYLEDYGVQPSDIYIITETGPIMSILPNEGKLDQVYNAIKDAHPNMTVYLKEDIPEYWHYQDSIRILPILVVCNDGWEFLKRSDIPQSRLDMPGNHGYDNRLMSMKPLFIARGPGFKDDFHAQPFDTVDIYPLMCDLMGLQPAPNNGSLSNVRDMIEDDLTGSKSRITHDLALMITAFLMLLKLTIY